jgi:hypothetical protein
MEVLKGIPFQLGEIVSFYYTDLPVLKKEVID